MKDDVYWRMIGMRDGGLTLNDVAEKLAISVTTVKTNLAKGPPSQRVRRKRATNPAVKMRRQLVRKYLTRRVQKTETLGLTRNMDGTIRKNSRVARTQTRHPTGSLSKCRRQLNVQHGIAVSRSTIHRDRVAAGLACKRRPRGPERYVGDEERRLQYAKKTLPLAKKHGQITLFVDEKMFDSQDSDIFAYVDPNEPAPAREVERFPPRVHVFGMVGVGYRFLHVFKENEKVGSTVYRERCIRPNLRAMASRYFVHDNAGPHKGIASWLEKQQTRGVLKHPPRSPPLKGYGRS